MRKMLFCSQIKNIILNSAKAHMHSRYQQNGSKAKVQLKLLDVFEDLNDIADMNGSLYIDK